MLLLVVIRYNLYSIKDTIKYSLVFDLEHNGISGLTVRV